VTDLHPRRGALMSLQTTDVGSLDLRAHQLVGS